MEPVMRIIRHVLPLALVALIVVPVFAQNERGQHWVASWATALVARAQGQGGPGGGRGPAPVAQPPAQGAQPTPSAPPPSGPGAPTGAAPAAPTPPGGGRGGFPAPVTISN